MQQMLQDVTDISIHSLRMEGDKKFNEQFPADKIFQSTPSAWRETSRVSEHSAATERFQSTPSAWRETTRSAIRNFPLMIFHFNPLPPHGGRRFVYQL